MHQLIEVANIQNYQASTLPRLFIGNFFFTRTSPLEEMAALVRPLLSFSSWWNKIWKKLEKTKSFFRKDLIFNFQDADSFALKTHLLRN